jgi:DNA mismatch repair protein MSH5
MLNTAIDGVGLACGIFNYLLQCEEPPKVIASTHLHEILENGFLELGPRLQLGHMEVKISEDSQNAEDQITYLYKYEMPNKQEPYSSVS